jgi:putative membrane-bound dehydrogenase-like protein
MIRSRPCLAALAAVLLPALACADEPKAAPVKALLLGDLGHHRPAEMARIITPPLAKLGVEVEYTRDVDDLNAEKLAKYDVLMIFRDSGDLPPKAEVALIDFVEGGKGLVAIHCASHCFRNSDRYTSLVGGRFWKHNTGTFRARIVDAQHPAMRGVGSFEAWDETYMHNQLAGDIRVLMVREEAGGYEPYTWVRNQGQGRVFYTALGHDERAWKHEGYQKLLAQAAQWAAGRVKENEGKEPFKYVEAKVPNYLPGRQWGAQGEPINRMQLPLSPAESMKHMHLPEGLEIKLYASEPNFAKPICMAWDERGRLWLAETVDYPNDMQPMGQGHDRILICEDTTGSGVADKFTVFADKLSIPTGIVLVKGGCIVVHSGLTELLLDTRGEGKADTRKVLFRGWGTRDTHAGPSNLRWGPDGWVWGTVGYSGFTGIVGGKVMRFGQGVYRFKPDGSAMEFLTSTSNNTWGLGFGEAGDVFISTANNQHSVYLGIPNRYFEAVKGWHGQGSAGIEDHKKIHPITTAVRQVDFHGGFTAAAGHAVYTAGLLGPDFRGKVAFVCEPTGHLVHMNRLVPKGSSFVSRDGWNLLASDDEWTSPILAEVGPDGAVWVIDWYNFIVQHNPTPQGFTTGKGAAYVTPLRDKKHGRIYRILPTAARVEQPKLDREDADGLVKALTSDNLWVRQTAQRLLLERGKTDVADKLAALVRDPKSGPAAFHALWALHNLGALTGDEGLAVAAAGLKHGWGGARRAALAVLPRVPGATKAVIEAKVLEDADLTVRRDALLALSELPPSAEAAAAVVALLLKPETAADAWLPNAAVAAAARNDRDFLTAALAAKLSADNERSFAAAVKVVAGHHARLAPPDAGRFLKLATNARPVVSAALLGGLADNWPADKPLDLKDVSDAELAALSGKLSVRGQLELSALVRRWGQERRLAALTANLRRDMLDRLADPKQSDEARGAAARDLLGLGGDAEAVKTVLAQITPQASPGLTRELIEALGQSDVEGVGAALVERWATLTLAARAAAVPVLLRRAAWSQALLDGLEKGDIDKNDLSVDQSDLLAKHPDKLVATRAAKVLAGTGRLPNPDRKKVLDEFLPLVEKRGDPVQGRAVFEKNCAKCHRHGTLGSVIGPDLTGMAVRDRADLLIDILDPNRSVEGNYRQYVVTTRKGTVISGLLIGETQTAIEMVDAEAKKHVILREKIEKFEQSKNSLMPEGFEKLGGDEIVALLAFLTARDRYLPLPLGKAATITSVKGMFISREADEQRLVFPEWGQQTFKGVPFQVIDPRGGTLPNVVLLYGPGGAVCKEMPKTVTVPCNVTAKAIHMLGGVGGWAWPYGQKGTVSLIVRLHYADGKTEDHELKNGEHMADYIRVVEVPKSELAFRVRGQQVRYLKIEPKRPTEKIAKIELVKGPDGTAPVVVALTVEAP